MSRRRFVRDSDTKTPIEASLAFALNTFRATSLLENLTIIEETLIGLSLCCVVWLFKVETVYINPIRRRVISQRHFAIYNASYTITAVTPGNCFTP